MASSSKRQVDFSSLLAGHGSEGSASPALPGRLQSKAAVPAASQPASPETRATVETVEPDAPSEERSNVVQLEQETTEKPAKKSAPAKRKSTTRRTVKRAAQTRDDDDAEPAKPSGEESQAEQEPDDTKPDKPDELTSKDGRPAALWDTAGGVALPEGWALEAIERTRLDIRDSRNWRKANPLMPVDVHTSLLQFLLNHAKETGTKLSLSCVLEAALEQLPQDLAGLEALIHEVPDRYFEPNMIRPHSNRLRADTADRLSMLPLELRAAGYSKHSGICQTAVILRLLKDLDISIDDA